MDRSAPPRTEPSLLLRLLLAGASNCVSAVVTNPLDVIKTRVQLSRDAVGLGKPRRGLLATAGTMVQAEGVLSLYSGLLPSLMREASYSALRLGLYEPARGALQQLMEVPPGDTSYALKLAAGAVSGCTGAAIANPTDLVKVRLQAAAGGRVRDVVARVWRSEGGVPAFWQGVVPNVQRAALLTASQVGTYDEAKVQLKAVAGMEEGLQLHCTAAVVAGLAAALVTSPVDVAKTRLMNQQALPAGLPRFRSVWHCLAATVRGEGVLALWKGFLPQWARIGMHTVITFTVYERLRRLVGMQPV